MQSTKTIAFSPEHAARSGFFLLSLLQELQNTRPLHRSLLTPLNASTILLLDTNNKRARYIASLLSSTNYRPYISAGSLEAFTLFLQGEYVPFAIVLGQHDPHTRFFLTRLLGQMKQRYRWEPPLITLSMPKVAALPAPNTDPLELPSPAYTPERLRPASRIPVPTPLILPRMPETSSALPLQLDTTTQTTIVQTETAPRPVSPTSITDVIPIINVSTHDLTDAHQVPLKISLEGLSIGRYHMKTLLGSGFTGQVYLTYDRLREEDVALKAVQLHALPPAMHTTIAGDSHAYQREIDLLSRLNHPHILCPLNCGKSYISGSPFIYKTMPYYTEGSLATQIHQFGSGLPFSLQQSISLILQIADALQHAHNHSIIYQNFKLSNLLVRSKGPATSNIHILLTDFPSTGNSALLTRTPDMFPYIAPESWYGQPSPASDQYSLAALAYQLLTGQVLFQGHSESIMRQLHTTMPPRPLTVFNPHISPTLSNIVLRALAKRPDHRFPSIMHFAEALYKTV